MLNIRDRRRRRMLRRRFRRDPWIIKVVRRAPKGVDLKLAKLLLAQLLEKPVHDETALDAALGDLIADPDVGGAVVEGALDEALDDVEEDAGCAVVGAADGALEGEGETVNVCLHPVTADADAVDEDPFLVCVSAELFQDCGVGFKRPLGAVEEVAEELVEEDEDEDVEGDHPDWEEEPERHGEDEDALRDEEDHVVGDGEDVAGRGVEFIVESGGPGAPRGDDGEDGGEEVDEGDEVGAEELPGGRGVGEWCAGLGKGDEGPGILICGAGGHFGVVDCRCPAAICG
ncbi:hypothetical protein V492_06692 [Pseudogymnoascus sp. VKM F-4246]|nr:hypothetical protein V492_06692 [Pseudogymnoascus sp. VKM F-4246]